MVFFFGLAAKEVTEACLPGGSLNPPRKAMSPLIATLGGVAGPVCTYIVIVMVQWELGAYGDGGALLSNSTNGSALLSGGDRRLEAVTAAALEPSDLSTLIQGWGVPTATDISLAWMVAMQVFPFGHPAVDYLLLLAVADDAVGLVIIATAYSDPAHPVQPQYLPLILLTCLICLALRSPHFSRLFSRQAPWWLYLLLAGIPAWIGLVAAQLHPALALCFVVPFMPARHHSQKVPPLPEESSEVDASTDANGGRESRNSQTSSRAQQLVHDTAPLDAFEHSLKLPVDLGLFLFTLANAGVDLSNVGPLTPAILFALAFGKLAGITGFAMAAHKLNIAPLPAKMSFADLAMVALIASIGLTVALFIAGEAFEADRLKSEAKMGALLSGGIGLVAYGCSRSRFWKHNKASKGRRMVTPIAELDDDDDDDVYHTIAAQLERSLLLRRRSLTTATPKPMPVQGPPLHGFKELTALSEGTETDTI